MLQDAVRNSRGSLSAWKMPAEFYENKDMNTEGKLIILQKKKKKLKLQLQLRFMANSRPRVENLR